METSKGVEAKPSFREAVFALEGDLEAAHQQLDTDFKTAKILLALDHEGESAADGYLELIRAQRPSLITDALASQELQTPTS